MCASPRYFELQSEHTDPKRVKAERKKAHELKKSGWWKQILQTGICHYCEKKVGSSALTMDHKVPIARGGHSSKGNIVAACRPCNQEKGLDTPVDRLFELLEEERARKG